MAYQAEFEAAMQLVGQDDQFRKGTWLEEEDERLISFVQLMGDKKWDALAKASGLKRSGKSCRLRWLNYLHPNLKHGRISVEEEKIILQLHEQWGNKWSKIARRLPGRTDNEIKNYWRTHLRKKVLQGDQDNQTNKDKEDCLFETKNYESSPKKHINYENINTHDQYYYGSSSLEGYLGTSLNNSPEASVISAEFGLTNSPYENRFSDWISQYSNGQSEIMMNYQNESSLSVEYTSSSGYCDYYSHDSWDCSGFLWDMNQ